MNKSENKKTLEALNLNKNEYFPVKKIDLKIDNVMITLNLLINKHACLKAILSCNPPAYLFRSSE